VYQLYPQGVQINDSHLIQVWKLTGALAGIEFKLVAEKLDGLTMGVPEQCQVVLVIQILVKIPRIMNDQYGTVTPLHLEGRIGEMETVHGCTLLERIPRHIIVSVHAEQACAQSAQCCQGLDLGDVPRMNDSIHTRRVENIHHFFNIRHIVVCIADYPNTHNAKPLQKNPAKEKPGLTRLSLLMITIQIRRTVDVPAPQLRLADFLQNVYATSTAKTDHMSESQSGAFDLAITRFTPQMSADFIYIGNPGCTQWMTLRQQAS
jgi:hypothetical protein